jgi:hypothetical protein
MSIFNILSKKNFYLPCFHWRNFLLSIIIDIKIWFLICCYGRWKRLRLMWSMHVTGSSVWQWEWLRVRGWVCGWLPGSTGGGSYTILTRYRTTIGAAWHRIIHSEEETKLNTGCPKNVFKIFLLKKLTVFLSFFHIVPKVSWKYH